MGNCALRQHRAEGGPQALAQARDHFAAIVEADPTDCLAANNLAWLLVTEFKRPEEAVRVIDKARSASPAGQVPSSVIHTSAVVYRAVGRAADARRLLEETLALRPDQAILWLELGRILADGKKPQDAREPVQRALALGLPDKDADAARRLLEKLDATQPLKPIADPQLRQKQKK
jgi:predicted Zn-dependent protease